MKALMRQLVRLHYCEWGVGDDQPPSNTADEFLPSLLAFCVTFILYSMLVLDARKMALLTPLKDDTCIDDISLGQLTTNAPSPFLAKRTSAQLARRLFRGSLNLCSMVFVLPSSRLKMTTFLFSQAVIQTWFLSLTRAALNGQPISLSTGREVFMLDK